MIENARATPAVKECWKHRLQVLKRDLGYDGAPMLEQLLIQQTALCWLKLTLVELGYSSTMKQSITLTLGAYWEKRLSAAQKRFTRACETLTRVRKRDTRFGIVVTIFGVFVIAMHVYFNVGIARANAIDRLKERIFYNLIKGIVGLEEKMERQSQGQKRLILTNLPIKKR